MRMGTQNRMERCIGNGTGRILEVRGRYSGDEDDFQVYDLEHKVSQRPEYG